MEYASEIFIFFFYILQPCIYGYFTDSIHTFSFLGTSLCWFMAFIQWIFIILWVTVIKYLSVANM